MDSDSSTKFSLAFFLAILFHLLVVALFALGLSYAPDIKIEQPIAAMRATVLDEAQLQQANLINAINTSPEVEKKRLVQLQKQKLLAEAAEKLIAAALQVKEKQQTSKPQLSETEKTPPKIDVETSDTEEKKIAEAKKVDTEKNAAREKWLKKLAELKKVEQEQAKKFETSRFAELEKKKAAEKALEIEKNKARERWLKKVAEQKKIAEQAAQNEKLKQEALKTAEAEKKQAAEAEKAAAREKWLKKVAEKKQVEEKAAQAEKAKQEKQAALRAAEAEKKQAAIAEELAQEKAEENRLHALAEQRLKQAEQERAKALEKQQAENSKATELAAQKQAQQEKLQAEQDDKLRDRLRKQFTDAIEAKIKSHWNRPIATDGMVCVVRVQLNKNGQVKKAFVEKTSGNKLFDESASNAVYKAEPFDMPNDKKILEEALESFPVKFDD
jgi:colicin import membrane protein